MVKLHFEKGEDVSYVVKNRIGEKLGLIYYHSPWKCHVWEQFPDIVISSQCLRQIDSKCVELDGGVSK